MTTLVLSPPCDLINANQRLHYHAKAELTRAWRGAAYDAGRRTARKYTRARVVCEIRFPNNIRRDVGNYYPTAKACLDGIVDAGLLPDDNDLHVTGPDMRRDYPNGPLRITLTIWETP